MIIRFAKEGLESILAAPINERIQQTINELVEEYQKTGTVSEESAALLIGRRPTTFPIEHKDTDAMAANLVSQREYDRRLQYVRAFISEYSKEWGRLRPSSLFYI